MVKIDDKEVKIEDAIEIYKAYRNYILRENIESDDEPADNDYKFMTKVHGLASVPLNFENIQSKLPTGGSLGTFNAGMYIKGLCFLYMLNNSLVFKVQFDDKDQMIECLNNAKYKDFYDVFIYKLNDILEKLNKSNGGKSYEKDSGT